MMQERSKEARKKCIVLRMQRRKLAIAFSGLIDCTEDSKRRRHVASRGLAGNAGSNKAVQSGMASIRLCNLAASMLANLESGETCGTTSKL